MDSIKQTGLSFCRTESVVSYAASTPFDKAGCFCRYAEAAKEFLDNNDCTNDLFLAAYPIPSLDQNDSVLPDGFNSAHVSGLGLAERLLDLLDQGREDKSCEVVPVHSQDAGCAVRGITSALDNYLHRDAGPLV